MALPKSWRDLVGKVGRFVLAVDWYEEGTLYFSDQPFTLGSDQGDLQVESGLGSITLNRADASPEVRIVVDTQRVDWLASWRRGLFIERIPARLYRWHTGDTLEDTRLLVDGFLGSVSLADPTARGRLAGVLRTRDRSVGTLIPSHTIERSSIFSLEVPGSTLAAVVTAEGPSLGMYRPEVFGRPGSPNGRPAVPMLELTLNEDTIAGGKDPAWLLCGHLIRASSVQIWDDTGGAVSAIETVYPETDIQLRRFSSVKKNSNPWAPLSDERCNTGRSFWWGFLTGEGRTNPYRPGDLRGLGDVLRFMYERIGNRTIDLGRMETYAADLNQYQIDCVITEPVEIQEWIDGEILRVYPVRIIEGPQGLYCRRRAFRASEADAVATLTTRDSAGILVAADSPLTPMDVTLSTQVRVEYAFRELSTYSKAVTVGVTPGTVALEEDSTLRQGGAHYAEIGEPYVGAVEAVLEVPTTWDPATAQRLALDFLDREALPRFRRSYVGGPELEGLTLGDVVRLDDADLDADQIRLATIEDIQIGGPSVRVTLELLRDPLLYDVPTS